MELNDMELCDITHLLGNQPVIATKSLINVTKTASRLMHSLRPVHHIVMGKNGDSKSVIASHILTLAKPRSYVGNTTGVLGIQLISPVTPLQFGNVLLEALGGSHQVIDRKGDPKKSLLITLKKILQGNDTKLIIIDRAQYLSDNAIEYMIELCSQAACSTLLFGPPQMKKRLQSSPFAWSYFQREITMITKIKMDEFLDTILPQLKMPRWIYNENSNDDREMGKFLYDKKSSFRDLVIILHRASAHAIKDDDDKINLTHIELALSNIGPNIHIKKVPLGQQNPSKSPEHSKPIPGKKPIIQTRSFIDITKIASNLFRSEMRPQFHKCISDPGSGKSTIVKHITTLAIPRPYAGNTTGVVSVQLSNVVTTLQFGMILLEKIGGSSQKSNHHIDPQRSLFISLQKNLTGNDTKLIIIDNAHYLSVEALDYLIILCESCRCNALLFGLDRLENLIKKSFTAFSYFQRETTRTEWFDEDEFLNNILPQINIPRWQYKKESDYDRKMGAEIYKNIRSFRDLITIIQRASDHAAEKNQNTIKMVHIKKAFRKTGAKHVLESSPQSTEPLIRGYSAIEAESDRKRKGRKSPSSTRD